MLVSTLSLLRGQSQARANARGWCSAPGWVVETGSQQACRQSEGMEYSRDVEDFVDVKPRHVAVQNGQSTGLT
jgi:hypothetical protein